MRATLWKDLCYRLTALVGRARIERELDDELRFHLEREAEKLIARGSTPDEAVRRARLAFGGVARIKDDARDARGVAPVEHIAQDLRYALRGVRTHPFFTAVVVITLALGVGVNAAMFGVLDRTFVRAPAYLIAPASVSRVYVDWTGPDGARGAQINVSYPQFADLARWSRSISAIAPFTYFGMAVGDAENTRELEVGIVGAGYFDFFNARPVVGRFFDTREVSPPEGARVAVLGYGYWQRQYAGSPSAIGRSIAIGNSQFRIIGVAPQGFEGLSELRTPVAFVPLAAWAAVRDRNFTNNYGWTSLMLMVRRKPGVSAAEASADLTNAFRRSWEAQRIQAPSLASADVVHPDAIAAPIQIARGPNAGPESKVAIWIGGVALVVLLIACANVANLLLARTMRRKRELALRRAIGGTRGRLVQQLLTESFVLASMGTIAGLAAAQLAGRALDALLMSSSDGFSVATDARTVAFAVVLLLATTLLAGLVPALHTDAAVLADALKAGMRDDSYRRSRARATLLVSQIALSVVMLVGAGLFLRSLARVHGIQLGYDADRLVYVEVNERSEKLSLAERIQLVQRLEAESRSVPGVASATPVVSVPFWSTEGRSVRVAGIDSTRRLGRFVLQGGSPDYFATLGTRIIRGRGLSSLDRPGTPYVAVVSDAMAKALWKSDDPLGKCFRIGSDTMPCTTVVGVAENVHNSDLVGPGELTYYLPIAQYYAELGSPMMTTLFLRVNGQPDRYVEALRTRLQPLLPAPAFVTVTAVRDLVAPRMQSWSSGARTFTAFGALALLLAAVGLYAVIAFTVAGRTHELGIRIALGARPRNLLRLALGEGARVTLLGAGIGMVAAVLGGRAIEPLLYHESARDPWVFGAVAATLACVALAASAVPALRATRVDPNAALRAE